ncbi:MAG TPA: alpha/beta hydrolase [Bacteroidales bacterium]|nr:alpha/beta hydrolase [Bacteroidales bacterium]
MNKGKVFNFRQLLNTQNNKYIILLISLLFSLTACKVRIPSEEIAEDIWYINNELNIALKFDTFSKGQYISTQKAIAEEQSFTKKQSGKKVVFKFKDLLQIRGKITTLHGKFYIQTKDQIFEFRQYSTKAFPKPPYRYKNILFPEPEINEVEYGRASGYYSSKTVEKRENKSYTQIIFNVAEGITSNISKKIIPLSMDIYEPKDDTVLNRPLIVLLHAGAFIAGDKRDELVSKLALEYAQRGFVVASVNYRLGYIFLPGMYSNLERAIYSAVQDVRAALRYLSHNHETYRIDPDMIFIGGNSAGGFLSLYTTFMDDTEIWPSVAGSTIRMQSDLGCLDCSTNDLTGPFKIMGAINMWGAIDDLAIIKPQDQIPVLSIHGDHDQVVAYGYDFPFANVSTRVSSFFLKKMYGSASIDEYAESIGMNHSLYTFKGLEHEPHFDENNQLIDENYEIIKNLILNFINDQFIPPTKIVHGPQYLSRNDPAAEYWIEQEQYKEHYFSCENCLILSQTPNSAKIVWIAGSDKHQLFIAGIGKYGQVYIDTLNVRF